MQTTSAPAFTSRYGGWPDEYTCSGCGNAIPCRRCPDDTPTNAQIPDGAWMQKRDANGYPYKQRVIGYIDVPENAVETNHFEIAAWWETVAIAPGRYPVLETKRNCSLNSASAILHGTVIEKYTPSLFGGVPFGTCDTKADAGKTSTVYRHAYMYQVEKKPATLFGYPLTLLGGIVGDG